MCPFLEAPEGLSPATLEMLDRAFTAAWSELQASQNPFTLQQNEPALREAMVKSAAALAATGVREPERLKRHALHAAKKAKALSAPTGHSAD